MKSKKQNTDYGKVREILQRGIPNLDLPIESNEALTQKLSKAYKLVNIKEFLRKLDETCYGNENVKMKIFGKILHLLRSPKKTNYRFLSDKRTKAKLRNLAKDFKWFTEFFNSGEEVQIGDPQNKYEIKTNLEVTFAIIKNYANSENRDVTRKRTRGTQPDDIYRSDVLKLFLLLVIDLRKTPDLAFSIIVELLSVLTGDTSLAKERNISNLKRIVSEESHHYLSLRFSKQFRPKRRNP